MQTVGHENRFDSKRIPGEAGIWIFVLGDMMMFALLFGIFLYNRSLDPELFLESQATLNKAYGAVNVLLLLTSSLFVASAVEHLKKGQAPRAKEFLIGAFACGLGFSISKLLEYSEKFAQGINVETNDFYFYYFVLTGIHFFHLIMGMVLLAYLIFRANRKTPGAADVETFETGGIYWHMVDLLWIVLFPLIYMVQ
jgi:nitric oxide reductase NorE protein